MAIPRLEDIRKEIRIEDYNKYSIVSAHYDRNLEISSINGPLAFKDISTTILYDCLTPRKFKTRLFFKYELPCLIINLIVSSLSSFITIDFDFSKGMNWQFLIFAFTFLSLLTNFLVCVFTNHYYKKCNISSYKVFGNRLMSQTNAYCSFYESITSLECLFNDDGHGLFELYGCNYVHTISKNISKFKIRNSNIYAEYQSAIDKTPKIDSLFLGIVSLVLGVAVQAFSIIVN